MPTPTRFKKHPLTIAIQACCYTILGGSPLAMAAPTGGTIVGGKGTISQSGTTTRIDQASHRLALEWLTFDVGGDERVQFIQPSSSSVAFNRILSNNGSTIAGRIDANGQVILVNANGIFFTSTAVLNVGSIIASGLDMSPNDFMNGQYVFNEISGTSGAVVNSGLINASLGGNVALIGKQVKNDGLIVANLGTVTLAAGKQAVLTFDNSGLLGVRVTQEVLQSELGVDPAVLNSGEIQAQGGRVLLTASQSQDVFSRAVNNSGLEPATSVVMNDDGSFTLGNGADVVNSGTINVSTTSADQAAGRIVLIGQNVTSSGTLRADAQSGNGGEIELHAKDTTLLTQNSLTSARSESNGNGGIIKILGDKVGLFDQSIIDLSGANGGGQALIGGDYQGTNGNIRNASKTIVGPESAIYADALHQGNGGKVIVWANDYTRYYGNIFARGGSAGGNGGFAEVSGKEAMVFEGRAVLTAAYGDMGTLLLDPKDITICAAGTTGCTIPLNFSGSGDSYDSFSEAASTRTTLSNTALANQLTNSAVTLRANNDIVVEADVTSTQVNNGGGALDNNLTLEAGRSIIIDDNVNIVLNYDAQNDRGNFTATINHGSALSANRDGDDSSTSGINERLARFSMGSGSSIATNGGDITISTGSFRYGSESLSLNVGDFTLQTLNSSGQAGSPGNSGSNAGNIAVTNSYGDIAVNGQIEARGGDGTSSTNAGGSGGNGGNGGNIALQATRGSISVGASISSNGGTGAAGMDGDDTIGGGNGGSGGTAGSILLTVGNNLLVNANIEAVGGALGLGGADPGGLGASIDGSLGNPNTITFQGDDSSNTFTINNDIVLAGSSVNVNGGLGNDYLERGGTTANTWTITGSNEGRVEYSARTINFSEVENLTGNGAQDIFIFNAAGSLDGMVDGGGGITDRANLSAQVSVDVTLDGSRYINVEEFVGNNTNSTLRGDNIENNWAINGTNSGTLNNGSANAITFSDFNNLVGNDGVDNFTFGTAGTLSNTGSIDGLGGPNSLTLNTLANATIVLNNTSFYVSPGAAVDYSNITNIMTSGGSSLTVNGVDILGTLTLSNTTASITSTGLTADALVLSNVSQFGVATGLIDATLNSLSVQNSGAVYLSNTGNLTLSSVSTTGAIDIQANGNITSNALLVSSGALSLASTNNGNISLTNQSNILSGALTLTGGIVQLGNSATTNFAGVTAGTLMVNATGDITQTGALNISGATTLNAAGRTIALNNPANILNTLFVSQGGVGGAAQVSIQTQGALAGGFIDADSINLTTVGGIGPLTTEAALLTVNNTSLASAPTAGSVTISNTGDATVSITNRGDINFTNNGNLIIERLYTNGGVYAVFIPGAPYPDSTPYIGNVNLVVTNGTVSATSSHTAESAPDIVAENLNVDVQSEFGAGNRYISVRVRNTFTYTGGDGYVYYYGETPTLLGGAPDLTSIDSVGGLSAQQLLDIDSLDEFDPAIFTEVRNYYYEDVAIMLPSDQRLDASDDEEKEEEKEGKL